MNDEWKVKVYCKECGIIFWHDELLKWHSELQKRYVPIWFTKARLHELDVGHEVLVKYPSDQTVRLMNPFRYLELYKKRGD